MLYLAIAAIWLGAFALMGFIAVKVKNDEPIFVVAAIPLTVIILVNITLQIIESSK